MSAEAKIREALAAGPLKGPWFAERDFSQWRISNFQEAKNGSPRRVAGVGSPGRLKTSKLEQENARTAEFIAACGPTSMTELLAELDRLRAEVEGLRAWQDIATAPRHTEVLVWREDSGPFIAKLTTPDAVITPEEMEREGLEFPDDFEEWFSDAYGWQEGSEKPTHWRPLPDDPLSGPKGQGSES